MDASPFNRWNGPTLPATPTHVQSFDEGHREPGCPISSPDGRLCARLKIYASRSRQDRVAAGFGSLPHRWKQGGPVHAVSVGTGWRTWDARRGLLMLDPPATAAFGAVREAACGARQSDVDVMQSGMGQAPNSSPVGGPASLPAVSNDAAIDLIARFLPLRRCTARGRFCSRIAIPSWAIELMPARRC